MLTGQAALKDENSLGGGVVGVSSRFQLDELKEVMGIPVNLQQTHSVMLRTVDKCLEVGLQKGEY